MHGEGHSAIAKIAESHLTSKARKALNHYLGGLPITAIASDPDVYRGKWTMDLGYQPTNPNVARGKWVKNFDFSTPTNIVPYAHSIAVDENFNAYKTDNKEGEYFENAAIYIDRLSKELKENAKGMDSVKRHIAICMVVHLVGDMHCPMHIRYLPKDTKIGYYDVTINDKKENLHKYWDSGIFNAAYPWSFSDIAEMVDNASRKEIKHLAGGDVYDWAKASAIASWPLHQVEEGGQLPSTYATDMRKICFTQLRNAGYRLAALLNNIFK